MPLLGRISDYQTFSSGDICPILQILQSHIFFKVYQISALVRTPFSNIVSLNVIAIWEKYLSKLTASSMFIIWDIIPNPFPTLHPCPFLSHVDMSHFPCQHALFTLAIDIQCVKFKLFHFYLRIYELLPQISYPGLAGRPTLHKVSFFSSFW